MVRYKEIERRFQMVKQSELEHFKVSKSAVIHPVYKEKNTCSCIEENLGYDLNAHISKEFGVVTKINTLGKFGFEHLYFLGLGDSDKIDTYLLQTAFAKVITALSEDHAVVSLKHATTDTLSFSEVAYAFTKASQLSQYSYLKKDPKTFELVSKEDVSEGINTAVIEATAINHARTLANTPSNLMNPLDIEKHARTLAEIDGVSIDVLGNKELKELGAGGILGVNQGSDIEARLIVLKYEGAPGEPFTALIGKGVTFDTGGYNLKPSASMANMKGDMHGAASVLSAFEIIAQKKPASNVYCIVASTENMIDGSAFKADDVLTMLSGKTVEITNTDAEGRLILADALTYAQKNLGVTRLINVATLTGACVVGLGSLHTGVWSNDEDFYNQFNDASLSSNELTWRMPLHDVFSKVLKNSIVADLVNSAAPNGGGANVAAAFLQEFVEADTQWIHLDIAGSSGSKGEDPLVPKGASGVMVASLANLFK